MARIKVELYGPLRQQVGKKEIEVDAGTIRDVFNSLFREHQSEISKRIAEGTRDNVDGFAQVVVNGTLERNLDTKLKLGDQVKIVPLVAGG